MIRHESKGYFVGAMVVGQGTHEIKAYWSPRERSLTLDGKPVRRVGDYLGTLRCVVFCTEDLQLIKGSARVRRRFLDLLLSQTQPQYLTHLLRYTAALRSRNALLKQQSVDEAALESFTVELAKIGEALIEARREFVPKFSPLVRLAFRRIGGDVDELKLEYAPSVAGDLRVALANARARERIYKTTLVGPHRDDLSMRVNGKDSAEFTSEGQKRTLAIALKMAQAEYLAGLHGTPPVLLIDDVMGELDRHRRAGMLPLLNEAFRAGGQVFMTCTEESWPEELGRDLIRWEVEAGVIAMA